MIGHDYRPNKKISLIGLTHTLELRVALTHNNKKIFCFQLNYRQLPPLSAPNPSCSYSFTQLIDQNDLLSAKQQPYVRGRIYARSSTISSARNSLWIVFGTNGHPYSRLEHSGSDAQGFQRLSYNASSYDRKPTWRNANDERMEEMAEHVGMNYPDTPDSRYVAQPVDDFLFPWEMRDRWKWVFF